MRIGGFDGEGTVDKTVYWQIDHPSSALSLVDSRPQLTPLLQPLAQTFPITFKLEWNPFRSFPFLLQELLLLIAVYRV